ncbi:hypothetical protein GQ600_25691 [Phytophthora cactorum]|nr:hypothetical protein GQ600_25691 [Phytophthora cactorum]
MDNSCAFSRRAVSNAGNDVRVSRRGVKNTPIDTRGFKNLVRLWKTRARTASTCSRSLQVQPNSEQQIQKFRESLTKSPRSWQQAALRLLFVRRLR